MTRRASGRQWCLVSLVGALGGNVRSEDSCDLGRFRFSRALSRSSIRAISSKALILALSSFSSWDVRGLPSFRSLAKTAAVLTSRLLLLEVVVAFTAIDDLMKPR